MFRALLRTADLPDIQVRQSAPIRDKRTVRTVQRLPQKRELSPQATEGVFMIKPVFAECTIDTST